MNLIPSLPAPSWAGGLRVVALKCMRCNRSMALRHLSARKAGIRIGEGWYCSSACFTARAEREFAQIMKPQAAQGTYASRTPLGAILMSRGLVTSSALKEAAEEAEQNGEEIGEALVRQGSVTEKQVTGVRAAQWGCAVFSMPRHGDTVGVALPFTLIDLYSALPAHFVPARKQLLVGFTHSVEYGLLYAIEQITGCKTQPCFITPSDFRAQRKELEERRTGGEGLGTEEIKTESMHTATEMAGIVCNWCIDMEAEQAVIGRCRDYFWARIKAGARVADLLFRAA